MRELRHAIQAPAVLLQGHVRGLIKGVILPRKKEPRANRLSVLEKRITRKMNKKQIKPVLEAIKTQWNADIKLDYAFLQNEKGKVFIINKEFADIDLEKLNINSLGLYLGFIKNNRLRLSIEGSQLVGPKAKKNIIELTDSQIQDWLKGEDIETNNKSEEFVLIKNNKDFFGTGKIKPHEVVPKTKGFRAEGYILNFIPKGRRLK